MPQEKDVFTQVLDLEDVIYNLKQIPILVMAAKDLFSGDWSIIIPEQKTLEHSLYLLELCEKEIETITKQIENIYEQLRK